LQDVKEAPSAGGWIKFFAGLGVGFLLFAGLAFFILKRKTKGKGKYQLPH